MNANPRIFPMKIRKLDALQGRVHPSHKTLPAIEAEVGIARAGWQGEISMDYYYRQLDLPLRYFFLHQLRLQQNTDFFQMNTLLLTQYFLLLLEIKNYAGHLLFDHAHQQIIRTRDEKQDVFPDPALQVQQQAASLRSWLQERYTSVPPIYHYVVMTHPRALISTTAYHPLHQYIIRPDALCGIVQDLLKKESSLHLTPYKVAPTL
ncbi:nuclease-related domain-containing protein [Salicibibacter kimchii]|uniref:NERD domain-containing protein n=1 Tax=Salicibibacter kimchii TaxID=2099786 RepID=A0A345BZV5_9BACI|nr:nuclease-related domain-containing protein [Salicibibacter kimchii]AXF56486.1 NERD domain-containing protein [Salicibibacter kimchii]